jgi:hypothetical protein
VLACALWALVHSVLASKQAKDLARRIAGPRYRDGLYRLAYNAQSVVLLAWAARWFLRLPDHDLYTVRAPWSWLFRGAQATSLGVLLSGVRVIGILDFAGITRLRGFLAGIDLGPEPEAQGPPIDSDNEVVKAGGVPLHPPSGQPGSFGFLLVLASHDGEPRSPHGAGGFLRGAGFLA